MRFEWFSLLLIGLAAAPLGIYCTRRVFIKTLRQAVDRQFYRKELEKQVEQRKLEFSLQQGELDDQRLRLETLQTQLHDDQRYQQAIKTCNQSLVHDFVIAVNQGQHSRATDIATHLTALLRAPFSTSEISGFPILELIDDVLVRLAPVAAQSGCRYLVIPPDFVLSRVEINAPKFQDILFHLLIQHLANANPGSVGIELRINGRDVTLSFTTETGTPDFAPGITMELGNALEQNDATWSEGQLRFPVRPHAGQLPADTGLRALVVARSDLERRSITGRLSRLGLQCTTELSSLPVDICVVGDETSETFRALHPYLSDATCVLLLGNRTVYQQPLWLQVDDPVTQKQLDTYIRDIARVKDESGSKHILAVDDSQANIQLLEMQLNELGHTVFTARSGTEALTQVEQHDFDLVFMDIQMPDMSGAEVTRRIRASNHKLPIIGLTAHATAQEREDYENAGMNDVLIKPVHGEKLKAVIQHMGRSNPRPPLAVGTGIRIPVFDLALSLANANQRFELAAELLNLLLAGLPEDQKAINDVSADYPALKKAVHKLHGAVHYCGVPRLTRAIEKLETALKQDDEHQVSLLLNLLNGEIAALIAWRRENKDVLLHPAGYGNSE